MVNRRPTANIEGNTYHRFLHSLLTRSTLRLIISLINQLVHEGPDSAPFLPEVSDAEYEDPTAFLQKCRNTLESTLQEHRPATREESKNG